MPLLQMKAHIVAAPLALSVHEPQFTLLWSRPSACPSSCATTPWMSNCPPLGEPGPSDQVQLSQITMFQPSLIGNVVKASVPPPQPSVDHVAALVLLPADWATPCQSKSKFLPACAVAEFQASPDFQMESEAPSAPGWLASGVTLLLAAASAALLSTRTSRCQPLPLVDTLRLPPMSAKPAAVVGHDRQVTTQPAAASPASAIARRTTTADEWCRMALTSLPRQPGRQGRRSSLRPPRPARAAAPRRA